MSQTSIREQLKESVEAIRAHASQKPRVGIVVGSGLSGILDSFSTETTLPYTSIPHFHSTSVEGHSGQLVLAGDVVFLMGRLHAYEGFPMSEVVFPVRTLCALGIHTLVLTNSAGGINLRYQPTDLMVIRDHINFMGDNPLTGYESAELGPRFPNMSRAYDPLLSDAFVQAARARNISVYEGVYAGVRGPTYETPAEVRMLRTLGADAVGMSTVPECIAACHLGVRVFGVSAIAGNTAAHPGHKRSHAEVLKHSESSGAQIGSLLRDCLPTLLQTPGQGEPHVSTN